MHVMKVALASIALLVGCSHGHSIGADSNTCSATSGCGLYIPWSVHPDVPSTLVPGVSIDSATFQMYTLRVIGDNAPGDDRTTAQGLVVSWSQGVQPQPVPFASAPSGLYSQLTLQIDGGSTQDSYLITGQAMVGTTMYPFTIHDRFALSVSLDTRTQLDPGGYQALPVQVDLAHCVGAIDWTLVHIDNNVLNLDTDDEWIPVFRQKLIESFSISDR
jgi:hypothetical protein